MMTCEYNIVVYFSLWILFNITLLLYMLSSYHKQIPNVKSWHYIGNSLLFFLEAISDEKKACAGDNLQPWKSRTESRLFTTSCTFPLIEDSVK